MAAINEIVEELINNYALVYGQFEALQKDNNNSILPIGDQKTGVIGEYYAKKYIEKTFTFGKSIPYAKAGADYDLLYHDKKGNPIKVQVKVVSAHSKTRTISPLKLKDSKGNPLFDFLYLIALDMNFRPVNFWINPFNVIAKEANGKVVIQGSKMKGIYENKDINGSKYFDFTEDKVNEMLGALDFIKRKGVVVKHK
jgi:hypothetical protein